MKENTSVNRTNIFRLNTHTEYRQEVREDETVCVCVCVCVCVYVCVCVGGGISG